MHYFVEDFGNNATLLKRTFTTIYRLSRLMTPELATTSTLSCAAVSGWLFKLELKDSKELGQLMNGDAYQAFLKSHSAEDH